MSSNFFREHISEIIVGAGVAIALSAFSLNVFSKKRKNLTRIIDTMESCKKPGVHMRDPDHVEQILSMLIEGGSPKLQVIADFDYTLSRSNLNGTKCPSSFGLLEKSAQEEGYRKSAEALFNYYYPLENDPHLSIEAKTVYVKEWYHKSFELLFESSLKEEDIQAMVRQNGYLLRDGCDVFFQSLYSNNVPLLVFSAGVGDVLKEVIKQPGLLYPNVKIISNFLNFNQQGKCIGFKGDLIHTFNKSQTSVENSDYFDHFRVRRNILLLGDSLGDLDMAKGVSDPNCVLRVGFLNSRIQENLPNYLKSFDIVLVDDQSLDVVNELLQHIL